MKGDWRMRLLGVQGLWLLAFLLSMLAVYETRPHYAPTPSYETAHGRWETVMYIVAGSFVAMSLAITAWFKNRYRHDGPPKV
ncbi:MAG TPA: hypothetical protein VHE55_07675 [Fimbriimonadaceae bacterium]|nr:hypothetical protein [Fimbriimonadaceae bacterium]